MQDVTTKFHDQPASRAQISVLGRRRTVGLLATLCVSLALSACASLGSKPHEEQVTQRATERWKALIAGEFSRAYTFNTPGFKAVVTQDGYRNRFGSAVMWVGAEVVRVTCAADGNKCDAVVRVDYKPVMVGTKGGPISTHVDETWLREDGQWWFFQKI